MVGLMEAVGLNVFGFFFHLVCGGELFVIFFLSKKSCFQVQGKPPLVLASILLVVNRMREFVQIGKGYVFLRVGF